MVSDGTSSPRPDENPTVLGRNGEFPLLVFQRIRVGITDRNRRGVRVALAKNLSCSGVVGPHRLRHNAQDRAKPARVA